MFDKEEYADLPESDSIHPWGVSALFGIIVVLLILTVLVLEYVWPRHLFNRDPAYGLKVTAQRMNHYLEHYPDFGTENSWDFWGNRFTVTHLHPDQIQVRSAGPDGLYRTEDDLTLNGGYASPVPSLRVFVPLPPPEREDATPPDQTPVSP